MNKYVIILIVAVLLVIYAGDKITKIRAKEHYTEFNSANINGELEMFGIAYKGVSIKLKGNSLEYIFYPNIDLKEKRIFDHIAEIGDVIEKPAYSDTLKLIKKDRVLLFTFKKFN